jgi:hypothetical protein
MIKGEYFNINDCNNLSLDFGEISNLTHDYYEYEQEQADIIVRRISTVLERPTANTSTKVTYAGLSMNANAFIQIHRS